MIKKYGVFVKLYKFLPKTRQAGQATVSGAVAGALVSKTVRNYILEKGFYVIEQTGDTVRINIPKGFKARNW